MRLLQVLPALEGGGVERGTVEFAAELVKRGHNSHVCSAGGSMVAQLEQQGSHHHQMKVHRKSLISLAQIRPFRRLLQEIRPDIVHVRSRMPAWINYLARKKLPESDRPALISTFHGMYSVNPYSAIMARAEQIIAVSDCVRDYVLAHYTVDPQQVTVVHRGVDTDTFHREEPAPATTLFKDYPFLVDRQLVLMPGRLSRWKGQLQFLEIMRQIIRQQPDAHGLIVGASEPGKRHFMDELIQRRNALGLDNQVTLVGARQDMAALYRVAAVVCHLSTKAEPFGRTVTEALASGTPVVGYDRGGVAESLQACFPQGLVPADDSAAFAGKLLAVMAQTDHHIELPTRFHLKAQADATMAIYEKSLGNRSQADE